MSNDIIGKKTRHAFREYLVGWSSLRDIMDEFDIAGMHCDSDYDPKTSGQRRSLVEQYYHAVNWSDWKDVNKVLLLYENIIISGLQRTRNMDENGAKQQRTAVENLIQWLKKDGFQWVDDKIVPDPQVSSKRIFENTNINKIPSKLSEADISRIWNPNCLRLFLSHVSTHKLAVSKLKEQLLFYGISGFVAHEDIEPTKEWIDEIELALGSAEVLVALTTPDFHESKWTDQEVGIALGRNILVVPVRVGCDPYGFMGKSQALTGNFDKINQLALDLVDIFIKNPMTAKPMREALTFAFEHSQSFQNSKDLSYVIVKMKDFTQEQRERIRAACKNNVQVERSYGVCDRIERYFEQFKSETEVNP